MNVSKFKKPLIIAHRGYKAKYPENTLSAFHAAVDHHALMFELDVTLSKDREPVIIHDKTLERTTDGKGQVKDHTLGELKGLDAGSWFSSAFVNEKIPTLDEILREFSQKIMINIEIKEEAYEKNYPSDAIEHQLIALLEKYHCFNATLISSFNEKIIARFGQMKAKPLTAYLSETPANSGTIDFLKTNKAFSWNADYKILTKNQISMMHENKIIVFAYTVNEISAAKKLIEMGVDGIFTDNIELFKNSFIF